MSPGRFPNVDRLLRNADVDGLGALLNSSTLDINERKAAAYALARLPKPEDVRWFRYVLDNSDTSVLVQQASIEAIGILGTALNNPKDKSEVVRLISGRLTLNHNEGVQQAAVTALGKVQGDSAGGQLASILDDTNRTPLVRVAVIEALSKFSDLYAREVIARTLRKEGERKSVQLAAIKALSEKSVVGKLHDAITTLVGADLEVRQVLVQTFKANNDAVGLGQIVKSNAEYVTKKDAIEALANVNNSDAVAPLEYVLSHDLGPQLVKDSVESLVKISSSVPTALNALGNAAANVIQFGTAEQVIKGLYDLKNIELLTRALNNPNTEVGKTAVKALASLYDADNSLNAAFDGLNSALQNPEPKVRLQAVECLGKLQRAGRLSEAFKSRASDNLSRILNSEGDAGVARQIVEALTTFKDADGLKNGLESHDIDVRKQTVEALSNLKSVDGLVLAISNDNLPVQDLAASKLIELGRESILLRDDIIARLKSQYLQGQTHASHLLEKILSELGVPDVPPNLRNPLGLVHRAWQGIVGLLTTIQFVASFAGQRVFHDRGIVSRFGPAVLSVVTLLAASGLSYLFVMRLPKRGLRTPASAKRGPSSRRKLSQPVRALSLLNRSTVVDAGLLALAILVSSVILVVAITPHKLALSQLVLLVVILIAMLLVVVAIRTPWSGAIVHRMARIRHRPLALGISLAAILVVPLITILSSTLLFGPSRMTTAARHVVEYAVPTLKSEPTNIVVGPDHNLWFTELQGNKIGHITLNGSIQEYPLSISQSGPLGITAGSDGSIWFTESNTHRIGLIASPLTGPGDPIGFQLPTTINPIGIVVGPDDAAWFAEEGSNKIGHMTSSGQFNEYSIPTVNSKPVSITLGANGSMWFTESQGNKIGRITQTGQVSEYLVPTASSGPSGVALGTDGSIWFTEVNADKIGHITSKGTIIEYQIPTAQSNPLAIVEGPHNDMWFTEAKGNKIGQISPTGQITEYSIPTTESGPSGIVLAPDGTIWFTEASANKIGRFSLTVPSATPTRTAPPKKATSHLLPRMHGNLFIDFRMFYPLRAVPCEE